MTGFENIDVRHHECDCATSDMVWRARVAIAPVARWTCKSIDAIVTTCSDPSVPDRCSAAVPEAERRHHLSTEDRFNDLTALPVTDRMLATRPVCDYAT